MTMDYPKHTTPHHRRGSSSSTPLRLTVPLFLMLFGAAYYVGYTSGRATNSVTESITDDRTALGQLGLAKDERVSMGLSVLQQAQGFSQAYPVYQNDKAAVVDKAKAQLVNSQQDDTRSEETIDKELEDVQDPASEGEDDTSLQEQEIEEGGEAETSAEEYGEDATLEDILSDYNEYISAPKIAVPTKTFRNKNLWWAVKSYENYYGTHPVPKYIPRLKPDVQLSVTQFHKLFRREARPVIFKFDNLRNLGFKTQSYTIDELKALFPFTEESRSRVQQEFVANGVRRDDAPLDLGPALVAIEKDEQLAKQGKLRNFPRNLKVKQSAVEKLGIDKPPLIKNMEQFQLPTVWMGTSTSDTRFHHDCCDNFVMMLSGTKRFTLAPPSDWRTLNPSCVGANKNLCWANVAYPNNVKTAKHRKIMDKIHSVVVDVKPGEILYMPAGWFHHIENLGPTVMVNWWTKQGETIGLLNAIKNPAW